MANWDPIANPGLEGAVIKAIQNRRKEIDAILGNDWYPTVKQANPGEGPSGALKINVMFMVRNPNGWRNSASFSLAELPGCCGVLVSYHVSVSSGDTYYKQPKLTGKGLGQLLLEIRMEAARLAGYTMMQATLITEMPAEEHILTKYGFDLVSKFKSVRTGNTIKIFLKDLYTPEKKITKKKASEEVLVAA